MIETEYGLKVTREAVACLEDALRGLTSKRAKYHPTTFAVIAEPIIDAIRMHRAEIDAFIGLTTPDTSAAPAATPAGEPLVGA